MMVAQPHIFLQADLYFPPALLQRSYFVTDPETDRSYVGQQMVDQLEMVVAQRLSASFPCGALERLQAEPPVPAAYGKRLRPVDLLSSASRRLADYGRSHNATEAVYEVNGPEI
jgi:hypothetical protein